MNGEQPSNTNQGQNSENEEVTCEGLKLMQVFLTGKSEFRCNNLDQIIS